MGKRTKRTIRFAVVLVFFVVLFGALAFSYFQRPFANSSFEFGDTTSISGLYFESPYPMLRVALNDRYSKDIVLLGYGKYGAEAYFEALTAELGPLDGQYLEIEGNLIYYNGKTLLQVNDSQSIRLIQKNRLGRPSAKALGQTILEGEVVDPKCYFGVMKPGYGKIHRSCAARCISGGIPPVLVTAGDDGGWEYFLLTDLKGNPINQDILPYIGQPLRVPGKIYELDGWKILRMDVSDVEKINRPSGIY